MKEFLRFIKFALFSISAGLIQIGSFTLLNEFSGLRYWPCYIISLVLSIIWNLTFNRKFTFKSDKNYSLSLMLVFIYYAIFTPITAFGGDYFVESVGVNEYVVTIANMILNFITEFLYQRFVVFRKSIDSNEKK